MRLDQRRDLLGRATLFAGLTEPAIAGIEALCVWRPYPAGATILSYKDHSQEVHFLIAGKARAVIYSAEGHAVLFKDILPGEAFGEIAAIDRGPRSSGIEAVDACTVASLSAIPCQRQGSPNVGISANLVMDSPSEFCSSTGLTSRAAFARIHAIPDQ